LNVKLIIKIIVAIIVRICLHFPIGLSNGILQLVMIGFDQPRIECIFLLLQCVNGQLESIIALRIVILHLLHPLFVLGQYLFQVFLLLHRVVVVLLVLRLDVGFYRVFYFLGILTESQCALGLFELPLIWSDAQYDCGPRVTTERGSQYFGQGRVSKWDVIFLALSHHCYDLCQEEETFVDVLALFHSHIGLVCILLIEVYSTGRVVVVTVC